MPALLEVRDLSVTFGAGANAVQAVKGVSFDLDARRDRWRWSAKSARASR